MANPEKFVASFERTELDLRSFIEAVVPDRQAREEVFQECATQLWRLWDRCDEQRPFGPWAREVANFVINQRRREDPRFSVVFSPEAMQALLAAYERTDVV